MQTVTVTGVVSRGEITYNANDIPPKMAADALSVQDASNLGGVVHSFDRVVSELQVMAREPGRGTDWVASHPVVTLYLEKFAHLNGGTYDHPKSSDCYLILSEAAKKVQSSV